MAKMCVYLAEDNAPMRAMLTEQLGQDFSVRSFANGQELLEAALVRPPEIIVTDVWMPVLSGIEAARMLKARGCTAPIVMISADADVAADCLEAGAAAFVSKVNVACDLVPAILTALNGHRPASLRDEMSSQLPNARSAHTLGWIWES